MPVNEAEVLAAIVKAAEDSLAKARPLDCADLALDATARALRKSGRSMRLRTRGPGDDPPPYEVPSNLDAKAFEKKLRFVQMMVGAIHLVDDDLLTISVPFKDLKPGDLVVQKTQPHREYTGHVMVVVSNDPTEKRLTAISGHTRGKPPTKDERTYQELQASAFGGGGRRWRWLEISPGP